METALPMRNGWTKTVKRRVVHVNKIKPQQVVSKFVLVLFCNIVQYREKPHILDVKIIIVYEMATQCQSEYAFTNTRISI